jgi:hypothetical protein
VTMASPGDQKTAENTAVTVSLTTTKHLKFNKCPIWHLWHGGREVS